METSFYALEDFAVGELVLVRNVNRKEPWWPVCVKTCCATNRHLAKHYMLHVHLWAYSLAGDRVGPHQGSSRNSAETDAARQTVCHVLWSTRKQGVEMFRF